MVGLPVIEVRFFVIEMAEAVIFLIILKVFCHVESYQSMASPAMAKKVNFARPLQSTHASKQSSAWWETMSVSSNCKLVVLGNARKDFSEHQHNDMVRAIEIHVTLTRQDWFWAQSTHEPFLLLLAIYCKMFYFTHNTIVSHTMSSLDCNMIDIPEGCFSDNETDNYNPLSHEQVGKTILFQVTNETGAVCQISLEPPSWTRSLYRRFCCRVSGPKNAKCESLIIHNKWLLIFNIIMAALLLLSVLYCPVVLFFVRQPFGYTASGMKLIRLDSPANPITFTLLTRLYYFWSHGDSLKSKVIRAVVISIIVPTLIAILFKYMLPSDNSWMVDTNILVHIVTRKIDTGMSLRIIGFIGSGFVLQCLYILSTEETRLFYVVTNETFLLYPWNTANLLLRYSTRLWVVWWDIPTSFLKWHFGGLCIGWNGITSNSFFNKLVFFSQILFLPICLSLIVIMYGFLFAVIIVSTLQIAVTSLLLSFPLVAFTMFACLHLLYDFFAISQHLKFLFRQSRNTKGFFLRISLFTFVILFFIPYNICLPVILVYLMNLFVNQIVYTLVAILLYLNVFLPYVTFILIVMILLCRCYNDLTGKYIDLRLLLLKTCRDIDKAQDDDEKLTLCQLIYPDENKVPRIPERLNHTVCSEMLPVGKTACSFVLKFMCTCFFFLFIFACIMAFGSSHDHESTITPLIQSIATLLVGTLPRLANLLFRRGTAQGLKNLNMKDRLHHVVLEFATKEISDVDRPNTPDDPGAITFLPQTWEPRREEEVRPRRTIDLREYEELP